MSSPISLSMDTVSGGDWDLDPGTLANVHDGNCDTCQSYRTHLAGRSIAEVRAARARLEEHLSSTRVLGLQVEVGRLEREISELTSSNSALDSEVIRLRSQRNDLRTQVEELKRREGVHVQKIADLETRLRKAVESLDAFDRRASGHPYRRPRFDVDQYQAPPFSHHGGGRGGGAPMGTPAPYRGVGRGATGPPAMRGHHHGVGPARGRGGPHANQVVPPPDQPQATFHSVSPAIDYHWRINRTGIAKLFPPRTHDRSGFAHSGRGDEELFGAPVENITPLVIPEGEGASFVRQELMAVPIGDAPLLDTPDRVMMAIHLVRLGERDDFATFLTVAYNSAVNSMVQDRLQSADDLPAERRAVFQFWQPWNRPGWFKELLLRHHFYATPDEREALWVWAAWFWINGPRGGVVDDADRRISMAHVEGHSMMRIMFPAKMQRPNGVSAVKWKYPRTVAWKLFACPGLYEAIVSQHGIIVADERKGFVEDEGFFRAANADLLACARWFANHGLQLVDADKMVWFMQELVRDRAMGKEQGVEYDDALWVSRWLVNEKFVPLSNDSSRWFVPEGWPSSIRSYSYSSRRARSTKHVLPVTSSDEELGELLGRDFDRRQYIPDKPDNLTEASGSATATAGADGECRPDVTMK